MTTETFVHTRTVLLTQNLRLDNNHANGKVEITARAREMRRSGV